MRAIGHNVDRGMVTLTLPNAKVIVSTRWEVNMTRKYWVASFAMVFRIP